MELTESDYNNIGFKLGENKKLELIFPKFLDFRKFDQNFNEIEKFQFYNLFKKYQKDYIKQQSIKNKDNFKLNTGFSSGNNIEFSLIESYFSLIEDFKNNELLLFNQIKNNFKPKGNINWKMTINKSQTFVSDENIIFNNYYFKNLNFNYNHPVTILYACALLIVSEKLNVKIHINYDFRYLRQLLNTPLNIQNILKKYKREMFSDREKRVFVILENIFINKKLENNFSKRGETLYFVHKFDMIWEKMLEIALFDQYDEYIKRIPKGKYFLSNGENKEVVSSGLTPKPDIIVSHFYEGKEYLLVLDAKNYLPEINMPKTGDINKQINYKFFLSKHFDSQNHFELNNIVNAFLLPSDKLEEYPIEYIGKHSFTGDYIKNNLGMILCFRVDFFELRKNYLNPSEDYRKKILNYISQVYLEEIAKNI